VAITLKTKGGLDYLSFDDLYNKLWTLEIDVKGGSSYDSRGTSAPTHSAFISVASTNSKMSYADSQNQSPSITFTTASSSADTSSNVIESVLHSFVAESDPQQQITYEDFDQIGKLDLEELDIKWQMAMLSVRINRFEKKAGRKMKFNNRDAARFDKKKVKCYKCSELGHFARECTGKQLDSKARYSAFKLKELDKSEDPKALLSVDSMLNWSDHEGEDEEKGAAQVYGMIAGDDDDAAGNASGDVSDVAAEFALMGLFSQVHTCPFGCDYTSNDFVSCDNSDKSSDSETTGFASCVSSVKSSSPKTNDHLASASSSVDFKTVCIIHEGGLVLFKCYSWTVWPSFDDKEFLLSLPPMDVMRIVVNLTLMVFHVVASVFMKAMLAFGVHAVNLLMCCKDFTAIIRFLIQEVWSWFQDVAV
ncbi:ribonuclease H-like domain-containing protein, partial [Tanacetum coccineum]